MSRKNEQTILVVSDDRDFRAWATQLLSAPGVAVFSTTRADEAYRLYRAEEPDLVIADSYLQPFGGMELLERIRTHRGDALVVITSDLGTTQNVIEAMRRGAFDFLRKESAPFQLRGVADAALRQREDIRQAEAAASRLSQEQQAESLIGHSPAMQGIFKLIGRLSASLAPVLITGESGTGKEVIARALHQNSPRQSAPFVAINCAAIPEPLLESELFGHEKGAFTGAATQRTGRFEEAAGGTLFLDEIGDMPLALQSKILRVLQDGTFSRLGGNAALRTHARIIAATNHPLEQRIAARQFREDLFYRLNVVRLQLPPLRERPEDIPLLAEAILHRANPTLQLSKAALARLMSHPWPGNVRELENTLQRASVLAASAVILPRDLPLGESDAPLPTAGSGDLGDPVDTLFTQARRSPDLALLPWLERELTRRALAETRGNQVQAALLLGISRATLRKRIAQLSSPGTSGEA